MANSVIKRTFSAHGGISINFFVMYVHNYHKSNFKPYISPIFYFDWVLNEGYFTAILCVKEIYGHYC